MAVLGALLLAAPAGAEEIVVSEASDNVVASLTRDVCQARLELRADPTTLQFRSDCAQSLSDRVRDFTRLTDALGREAAFPPMGTQLGLRRLIRTPELAFRLALAAHASPHWDASLGRPRDSAVGDSRALHAFIRKLATQKALFQPFLDPFADLGLSLQAVSVEKVLVGNPGQTPFQARLAESGVPADAKLPFDAIVWLELAR